MNIYPVILAGGSGTRLWPLSRDGCPKQFPGRGTARVTRGEQVSMLTENQSIYIDIGQVHRLEDVYQRVKPGVAP